MARHAEPSDFYLLTLFIILKDNHYMKSSQNIHTLQTNMEIMSKVIESYEIVMKKNSQFVLPTGKMTRLTEL